MEREKAKIEREKVEREKAKKEREKLERMMRVSSRIRLDIMRDVLNLDLHTFNEKIFEWAEEFSFEVDGDYLNINKDTVSSFIDSLEKKFSEWEKV